MLAMTAGLDRTVPVDVISSRPGPGMARRRGVHESETGTMLCIVDEMGLEMGNEP